MNAPVQDTLAPSADPRAAQRLAWARAATGEPALELARAGTRRGAVLLASPIDHDRHVHYEGGRKES